MVWFKPKSLVSIRKTKATAPDALWVKCDACKELVYRHEFEANDHVCLRCQHHAPLGARARIELLLDPGSFVEHDAGVTAKDPLGFKDTKAYPDRVKEARKATGMGEALLAGEGTMDGRPVQIGVLDFGFLAGTMASAVGEKIARTVERGIKRPSPVILVSASGGARMQEGVLSLMQMVKTAAALSRLRAVRQPYLSVLCDPTTGGVTASYAMLGDLVIAEPKALIGFAGPRVIQDTIRQELPPGFQRAEFLLEHGFIDMIVHRRDLRRTLSTLLGLLTDAPDRAAAHY
ncbi:MAG: acetyl-CoA carboxylase, carboxyltransferase subunit beta [Candidatus Methylomirabilales bacterium]